MNNFILLCRIGLEFKTESEISMSRQGTSQTIETDQVTETDRVTGLVPLLLCLAGHRPTQPIRHRICCSRLATIGSVAEGDGKGFIERGLSGEVYVTDVR